MVAGCARPGAAKRRSQPLAGEVYFAADAGDGAASDPDGSVGVLGDVDAARAAEGGALAGGVGGGRAAGGEQPLGEGGVEASGDRVLVLAAVLVGEGADLERLR